MNSHWEQLKLITEWASTTTDRRNVEVPKEILFWAAAELTRWELVRGLDLDLADEDFDADEPQALNEEDPL